MDGLQGDEDNTEEVSAEVNEEVSLAVGSAGLVMQLERCQMRNQH